MGIKVWIDLLFSHSDPSQWDRKARASQIHKHDAAHKPDVLIGEAAKSTAAKVSDASAGYSEKLLFICLDGAHCLCKLPVHWLGHHCRKSSPAASKTSNERRLVVGSVRSAHLATRMLDCPMQDHLGSAIEEPLPGLWLSTINYCFIRWVMILSQVDQSH